MKSYFFRGNNHANIPKYAVVYHSGFIDYESALSDVNILYEGNLYSVKSGLLARIDHQPHYYQSRMKELIAEKWKLIDRLIKQNNEIYELKKAIEKFSQIKSEFEK